ILHAMGKMIDTTEAARRLEVSVLRVQQLCRQRRIRGARLVGRTWMIPDNFTITPATMGPPLGSRKETSMQLRDIERAAKNLPLGPEREDAIQRISKLREAKAGVRKVKQVIKEKRDKKI